MDWEADKQRRLLRCKQEYQSFESKRERKIDHRCPTCGTRLDVPRTVRDDSRNPYETRLLEIDAEKNPFQGEVTSYKEEISQVTQRIRDSESCMEGYRSESTNLDYLDIAANQYRSQAINETIRAVEAKTNQFLTDFFDAEIRVAFKADAADKLEVTIFKDGNEASFTQLSKGQRQLLKFCFAVAVMIAVQNHHGISLNQLCFDEALDGLDDMKKFAASEYVSDDDAGL